MVRIAPNARTRRPMASRPGTVWRASARGRPNDQHNARALSRRALAFEGDKARPIGLGRKGCALGLRPLRLWIPELFRPGRLWDIAIVCALGFCANCRHEGPSTGWLSGA